MGKTRRTGDLVTDNNLYVNPTDDSFHVGTGITMYGGSVGIISCTSLYIGGSSVSASVVDDTTPQLGGDLDLNSSDITGTGNINITGGATVSGTVSASDASVASGHIILNSSGAKIIGVVTATSFVGDVTGNADTATTATNVTVSANNSTDETVYPIFVDGATGAQGAESDTGLTYNPSSGTLTATTFSGSGSNLTGLTGASHGTYGSSGATPVISVDTNGRISGISTAAISSGGGGGGGVTTGKAIAMAMVFG